MENTLVLTYEEFLALASDKSMEEMILKEHQIKPTENVFWHKYLEYDNKAPFSNYSSGHIRNGGANSMAKRSISLCSLDTTNQEKVEILNFVKRIITTDDYQKIGPAMDHFGCFIRECKFEDKDLINDLIAFIESPDVATEYRLIMKGRVVQILGSFTQFRELRDEKRKTFLWKEIETLEAQLYLKASKKGGTGEVADFLNEVYLQYKPIVM